MAKHCTNCGHELRATDKFCSECGAGVAGVVSQAQQWEYCEVSVERVESILHPYRHHLVANAVGPSGIYEVARSVRYNDGIPFTYSGSFDGERENKKAKPHLQTFIKALTEDGWEPLPELGANWFSYKFRRPFKRRKL